MERDALSFGCDTDSRNRGDLVPPASATQDGGLSAGRPGPGDGRDQQETTLVDENEIGFRLFGFFLYAAKYAASIARWPLRRVREPA
jgi:hypothetical protein